MDRSHEERHGGKGDHRKREPVGKAHGGNRSGDVTGGGPQTAIAGNVNVQIPIAITEQSNTANDSDTGQAGGVS